jgi:hypothetical protein
MLKLGAFISLLTLMESGYGNAKSTDKEFLKTMRMVKTLSERLLRLRMQFLDRKEIDKLVADVHKHQVVCRPKDVVIREQKEIDKLNSVTVITDDDFLDLVQWTIENTCKVCTNCGPEIEQCALRELWLKHDIAPLYPDATDSCPYQYGEEWQNNSPVGSVGEAYLKALKGA